MELKSILRQLAWHLCQIQLYNTRALTHTRARIHMDSIDLDGCIGRVFSRFHGVYRIGWTCTGIRA